LFEIAQPKTVAPYLLAVNIVASLVSAGFNETSRRRP
jgi:hypothetical protein